MNLQKYVAMFMNITEHITGLVQRENVTFGDVDLKQALDINMTHLLESISSTGDTIKAQYQPIITHS